MRLEAEEVLPAIRAHVAKQPTTELRRMELLKLAACSWHPFEMPRDMQITYDDFEKLWSET